MNYHKMKRWNAQQIQQALYDLQSEAINLAHYEEATGILLRAGFEVTAELVALERHYLHFDLIEKEDVVIGKFPVSGVFTQGIEGYAVYKGSLYRLLKLAQFTPRMAGQLRCALFVA